MIIFAYVMRGMARGIESNIQYIGFLRKGRLCTTKAAAVGLSFIPGDVGAQDWANRY